MLGSSLQPLCTLVKPGVEGDCHAGLTGLPNWCWERALPDVCSLRILPLFDVLSASAQWSLWDSFSKELQSLSRLYVQHKLKRQKMHFAIHLCGYNLSSSYNNYTCSVLYQLNWWHLLKSSVYCSNTMDSNCFAIGP